MRFAGSLADLSVADVLQVLQVARRSGLMVVRAVTGEAVFILRDGMVVACRHPSPAIKIGGLLLEAGAVTAADLEEGLRLQVAEGAPQRPLVGILVEMGRLAQEAGWKALERLVDLTLGEVAGWGNGTFEFEEGRAETLVGFGDLPEGWAPPTLGETQGVVSEALRIMQGREAGSGDARSGLEQTGETTAVPVERPTKAIAVLSSDGLLRAELQGLLAGAGYAVIASEVRQDLAEQLSRWCEAGVAAGLVVDVPPGVQDSRWERGVRLLLRHVQTELDDVPVVVLCAGHSEAFAEAFALGASAVLPRPPRTEGGPGYVARVRAACTTVGLALQGVLGRQSALVEANRQSGRALALLREHLREMGQSTKSGGVSLVALKFVAALVDRCILFLVREHDLLGVGAFGIEGNEAVAAGLKLPIEAGSLVESAIASGRIYHGLAYEPDLANHLHARIGAPARAEIVLVPLRARERTAALIYGDFGAQAPRGVDVEAIEILAEFAGLAFEMALREREASDGGAPVRLASAS
jgi:hypothetical protein